LQTTAILTIEKSRYLKNRLTDFDETWTTDAFWPSGRYEPKKSKFKNPRQQKAIILKMKIAIYFFKFPENVK